MALIIDANVRTGRAELFSSLVVLLGTLSWSIGMVYSRSAKLHPDPRMSAAMSLLAGAVLLLLAGTVTGEASNLDVARVSLRSVLALGYLALAGSLVAYATYFWLLSRFPPTLIATHTYVNPLVALVLGWGVAGEVLSARFVFAGVTVIAAIVLVGGSRSFHRVDHRTRVPQC